MSDHGKDACLFFKPSNVRYATGTSVMATYCLGNHVRCALVPVKGDPILFEHPGSAHISGRIVKDVRAMHQWEYADDAEVAVALWADEESPSLCGHGGWMARGWGSTACPRRRSLRCNGAGSRSRTRGRSRSTRGR